MDHRSQNSEFFRDNVQTHSYTSVLRGSSSRMIRRRQLKEALCNSIQTRIHRRAVLVVPVQC